MADSKSGLINLALLRLGAPPVTNVDTDDTVIANKAKTVYSHTVNRCLGIDDWAFALAKQSLALKDTSVVTDANTFDLPSDFVRLVWTIPQNAAIDFFGNQIVANLDTLEIVYVSNANIDAPQNWPIWFQEYLIYEIATQLGYDLVESAQRVEQLQLDKQQALRHAKHMNHMQGTSKQPARDAITTARLSGGLDIYNVAPRMPKRGYQRG